MVMFINDTVGKLGNQFIAIYDDAQIIGYHGDLSFKPSEKLNFEGKINLYSYSMGLQQKAWQKPSLELGLSVNYNLKDKIIVKADVFGNGKRYAKPRVATDAPIELQGTADVNLGLEYRYTKILSFFLNLNNLTGSKYFMWNQYPSQGFNFMAGFTYAL
jgi:outer membrane receptor protein involved in Fe transport